MTAPTSRDWVTVLIDVDDSSWRSLVDDVRDGVDYHITAAMSLLMAAVAGAMWNCRSSHGESRNGDDAVLHDWLIESKEIRKFVCVRVANVLLPTSGRQQYVK